jgi:O-antigen/teichoic acid export membrane protein
LSKAADMAKVSVKGGFHLLWGLASSTFITSVGVIILARLLSPSDFGLYAIALAIANLIQIFRDWGTSYALVKYCAQYKSENNLLQVKEIIFSGLVFQGVLGIALTIITFLFSDYMAINLFGRPDLGVLIQVVSLSLLSGVFLSLVQTKTGTSTSVAEATFVGLEKTQFNSVALLVHSIIRTVLTSLFVIVGLGAFGAVAGYTLSLLLAGLTALFLLSMIYRGLPRKPISEMRLLHNLRIMLGFGFPLSAGTIVRGFLLQFYLVVLAIFASDALIGNYSVATNFVVLITFFATPVTTMLFPTFSKLDPEKERGDLKNVFRFSVKYGALLVVPVTFLVISLSKPAIFTLFGSQYSSSPLFLSLLAILYLYSAFGFLSVTNLLNGQGKTKLNLKLTLLTALIGFPLSYVMISQFDVLGLIFATLVAEVPSLVIGLYWVRKNYGLTIDWISSVKILLSSGVACGLTYFVVTLLEFASWIGLLIGVVVFSVLFLLGSLLTRIVDHFDIDNLRDMTKALGLLHKIFVFVFDFYEKLMVALKLE